MVLQYPEPQPHRALPPMPLSTRYQPTTNVQPKSLPSSLHCRPLHEVFQRRSEEILASYLLLVSPQLHVTTVVLYYRPHLPRISLLHRQYPHHYLHHPLLPMTEDNQFFSPEGMMHLVRIWQGHVRARARGLQGCTMAHEGVYMYVRDSTAHEGMHTQIN